MTAQTTDFSGLLYYNPAGPGFSADIRATVTADTVSRPALTLYVEPGYTGVPSEGEFSYMFSSSICNGTRCEVLSYQFSGVDGVITNANVLYDVNNAPRAVDDIFVEVTDPFGMASLYGTVVLKVGTIGNTGDEGNYRKFDVVSWGIQSPVGLNQLAASSSTCSITLNGDTKHYRIEPDNSQVQIDSLPEHAHGPLSLTTGTLYWRVANLQNLTTNRFTNTSSEFFINRNRASFNVYVNADNTTAAGVQTYDVIISKTATSPTLSTATGNVVNDTSQDPIGLMMDLDPKNYSPPIVTFADASGYSHNGILVGAPTFTTGGTNGSGNYFTLDGTSQYITVPSLLTSAYGSVTMSLWFNSSTGVGSLITKELSYKMRLNAGGSLAVLASSTGTGWQYNSTNVLDIASNDAWHHFAVSIGPDFVDWYLDGTRIQHEAGMGVDIHSSTRGVQIGGYDSNVPSELFTGKIGPARLYNYALTSQEVTDYYNATKDRYRPTTYSLATAGAVTSIDEGAALTFNVTTTNVADGTILTWTTDRNPTDAGGYPIAANRFSPADSGSVTINNNTGTFTVTISADSFTAPLPQLYNIVVAGSNTVGITVNDTSQTPPPPPPPSGKVISLNPSYIPSNAGTSIPNEADEGSTSATVVGAFTSSSAQGGSITLTDATTSAIYLPAQNVKTIGMWIKIINQQAATQYLLDSRERDGPNAGNGTGYFYSSGFEGWSLMSINGNPADNSLWSTVANNTNVWQYVTLINQTNTPHSITLFNRFSLLEGLATIQVGWIEAWDYIQLDSQITAAYASHSSNYV